MPGQRNSGEKLAGAIKLDLGRYEDALASATPVIAFRSGALPDIVEHNWTGFLVDTVEEMAAAINRVKHLNPEDCRRAAKTRFALDRMIEQYFAVYRDLAAASGTRPSHCSF